MAEHPRNPNRALTAEQVRALITVKLPHRAPDLEADRLWVWLATSEKPSEEDRTVLKEAGFGFTPCPHKLPSGAIARWYHACNHPVLRRRRGARNNSEGDNDAPPDNVAAFLAFANSL